MTTLRVLAAEAQMQPYELAAFLNLGRDYDETAEIDQQETIRYRAALLTADGITDFQLSSGGDSVDVRDLDAHTLGVWLAAAGEAGDQDAVYLIRRLLGIAPRLWDGDTNEFIGIATPDQWAASAHADPEGFILIDADGRVHAETDFPGRTALKVYVL